MNFGKSIPTTPPALRLDHFAFNSVNTSAATEPHRFVLAGDKGRVTDEQNS